MSPIFNRIHPPILMHIWYEFGESGSNRFRVIVITVFGDRHGDRQTDVTDDNTPTALWAEG